MVVRCGQHGSGARDVDTRHPVCVRPAARSGGRAEACRWDFDSRNDGNVIGYDCSGLTLFAWAPYLHMSHYAPNQWGVGSYHPSTDQLLPGDLVLLERGRHGRWDRARCAVHRRRQRRPGGALQRVVRPGDPARASRGGLLRRHPPAHLTIVRSWGTSTRWHARRGRRSGGTPRRPGHSRRPPLGRAVTRG